MPLPTAVTSPAAETVAMSVSDEFHVTVAPEIVAPSVSVTVGTTVAVSPTDANDRLVGASATAAAT